MTYAAALVDLDGTVWRGRELIPGADHALATLRERGVPVVFVTNNTGVRPADFATRLDSLGVDPDIGPVVTAGWATAQYLADH
ncbi:hypothetical protein [Halospeciosus flavus]|uniref:HAD family hydrolase n=1 Tax=Halospeciosus flavus TaxID=3032283 RepID=A0ABD5Z2G8_9EURY|nr:hypothetical protein [Halospeciosus flavus]